MADGTTYRDYWTNVEGIGVDAIAEAIKYSDDADEAIEAVAENVDSAIDSNWWVIYTHAAAAGLIHSDNESAFWDSGMDSGSWDAYGTAMTQMMYFALRQDVADRMPDDWVDGIEEHFEDE